MAIVPCAIGVWNAPAQGLDRPLAPTGLFFCLSAAFTLAKAVCDNKHEVDRLDAESGILTTVPAYREDGN